MQATPVLLVVVMALPSCVSPKQPDLLAGASMQVRQSLEELRGKTGDALLEPGQPGRIACLAGRLTFPGAMSLAALGSQSTTGRGGVPNGSGTGLTSMKYEQALENLSESRGIRFDEAQGKEALEILRSGRWHADFAEVLASLLDLAHQAPARAAGDLSSLHLLPQQLGVGILRDAMGLFEYRKDATLTLLDEKKRQDVPEVGMNTLKVLASTDTYRDVARTSSLLLANDSVRLAVILYAQSHGIEIADDDLDRVRELLASDDPSLASLIGPATEALVKRHAGAQGVALLEGMSTKKGIAECG